MTTEGLVTRLRAVSPLLTASAFMAALVGRGVAEGGWVVAAVVLIAIGLVGAAGAIGGAVTLRGIYLAHGGAV